MVEAVGNGAPARPRRRWRRWLGYLSIALALLLVLIVAGGWLALRSSLPRYEGVIDVAGLTQPVQIVRDEYAIPHIEAASLEDAAFAEGFVHAQDRLFQMEFQRRLGAGRLSEIVGPATLRFDRFMRTLGFYRLAGQALDHMQPETLRWLEAYARGVNAFLATRSGLLPPEFLILRHFEIEPWRPVDSVVWIKMMALNLSGNWRSEVIRAQLQDRLDEGQIDDLWPDDPEDAPVTLQVSGLLGERLGRALAFLPPSGLGSNAWVIGPSRTITGGAILANDPHLGMQAPGTWYLVRMAWPDGLLAGASMPGVPGVVLGHNGTIAWGLTTTGGDVQDLFIERLDPDDPARYLTPEGSAPFETRAETIDVVGGPAENLIVRRTRHGPVISDLGGGETDLLGEGEVAALAWPALAPDDTTLEGLFGVMQASGWGDFTRALEKVVSPQQNVFYADREGHIGLYVPGRVPIRRNGDGRLPVPGWSGEFDWQGWIPFDELPHRLDPASGALVNANNKVVPDDYPHLIATDWDPPYRAQRIVELIEGDDNDLARSKAIQGDVLSMLARTLLPRMLEIEPRDEAARDALARLRDWDRQMVTDLPEPTIFTAWYRHFAERAYGDELGDLYPLFGRVRGRMVERILAGGTDWCDDRTTAVTESCNEILAGALDDALVELRARLGDDPDGWLWGKVHQADMRHPAFRDLPVLGRLFAIRRPVPGDGTTVNVGHPALHDADDRYASRHGPSYRGLYDLADLDASEMMIATGQSGHPMSPNYADLTQEWAANRTLHLGPGADIDVGRTLVLEPAGDGAGSASF